MHSCENIREHDDPNSLLLLQNRDAMFSTTSLNPLIEETEAHVVVRFLLQAVC